MPDVAGTRYQLELYVTMVYQMSIMSELLKHIFMYDWGRVVPQLYSDSKIISYCKHWRGYDTFKSLGVKSEKMRKRS